jgi:hypothetical protein
MPPVYINCYFQSLPQASLHVVIGVHISRLQQTMKLHLKNSVFMYGSRLYHSATCPQYVTTILYCKAQGLLLSTVSHCNKLDVCVTDARTELNFVLHLAQSSNSAVSSGSITSHKEIMRISGRS